MTAAEMREEFLILYDKITNFDAPGYEDDEISRFLSRAQERLVLHLYNPLSNKFITGFEGSEKRRKDLSELMRNANLTQANVSATQTGVKPNGQFFDLPSDFLYAVSEEVLTASTTACFNGNTIEVKPIAHDEYTKNIKSPFKKPYKDLVWRMDFSRATVGANPKRHELITDGTYTVATYSLRYLRRPQPIIAGSGPIEGLAGPLNCELDEITHRAIIDEAVAIASGVTTPELWQLKRAEASISE
jgi:hypothetical protein